MRNAFLSLLIATAAFAETEPKTLIVSSVLADPSLVAPVVRMYKPNWEIGISGWTADVVWRRQLRPTATMVWAADATPIHSHNSNLIYVDGKRAPELDYDNGTYRIRGGVRFNVGREAIFDVRGVAVYERVKGLHDDIGKRWKLPYHGIEMTQTWSHIRELEPLLGSFDGIDVTARGEALTRPDQDGWSRILLTESAGHTIGRVHLVQSAALMHGSGLDLVNRFVVGGSWDSLRAGAIYGLRYGELRVQRALIGSGGADYRITDKFLVGARGSWIDSDVTETYGYAVHAVTKWKTNAIDIGVGIPKSVPGGDGAIVYATLIVPLYRK